MPPIAESIAATDDWPCLNSNRYIVISPSEIVCATVSNAIHAYAP